MTLEKPVKPRAIREMHIVVPANNEEELIDPCLDALTVAMGHPELTGVTLRPLVVLDRCTDGTEARCRARGIPTIRMSARNVGQARSRGFSTLFHLLDHKARGRAGEAWLATTDADTRVPADWLATQRRLGQQGVDAIFGVVDVDDWSMHAPDARDTFLDRYLGTAAAIAEPHGHVHGANLGLRAATYWRVGGFPDLAVGEDRALSDLLEADPQVRVLRTTELRVTTSGRRRSRVQGGFADLLVSISDDPAKPALRQPQQVGVDG